MRILHLEDNAGDAALITRLLRQRWPDCHVTAAADEAQFRAALASGAFDVVLADYHLGHFTGTEALRTARDLAPDTPLVYVSGTIGEDVAIEAVHAGAADYVLKDNLKRLPMAIERAVNRRREIAEKRRSDEQLRRVQRVENIGLIAAGMAHDLNNIFAPILLAIPLLQDHIRDPQADSLLSMLQDSARRGAGLVRHMLDFVNETAGGPAECDLNQVMGEIGAVVAETFPKTIRYEARSDPNLPPVGINGHQAHQVLMNLCVNARDAMPGGGRLTLRARHIPDLFSVCVEVEDSGSGIPGEVMAHMWEPFYTTKESGKGTGLGLSTVKGIVEGNGGKIEAITALGQGTTFRLLLPTRVVANPAVPPARNAAAAVGEGELILVVDDESAVRDVLSVLLGRAGFRTLPAADGVEALDLYKRHRGEIRLVIADNLMPNMDGPTMVKALKQIDPDARVLAVSGMEPAPGAAVPFPPGTVEGYLSKPYRAEQLLAAIVQAIRAAPCAAT